MKHTKFLLRILKVIGDNIVEGRLNNVLHETGTNLLDLDKFCRKYVEFWLLRNSDMKKIAHELMEIDKVNKIIHFDYENEIQFAVAVVLKYEDKHGLLSDSFDEIDVKLTLRGF